MENKETKGRIYSIFGIVFAVLSLIVLPIVFGPLAVIFGIIAIYKKDTKLGIAVIILGVALAVISTLIAMYFLNGSNGGFDEERFIKKSLNENYGYEVVSALNFSGLLLYQNFNEGEIAYLEMKSLGNRDEQIKNGLIVLSTVYENAKEYSINVLTPEERCSYDIDGNVYRSWLRSADGEKIFLKNGTEIDSDALYNLINYEIKTSERCS